jgi:thiamine-phosphate pyrophosphorylase
LGFELIVISAPGTIPGEPKKITALFKAGLKVFHLRKPGISKSSLEQIILSIPSRYHPRIVIREHFQLLEKYNLRGIHLTERVRKKGMAQRIKDKTFSASLHALTDAFLLRDQFDYVFISPVFDSISKSKLKQKFELEIVRTFMNEYRRLPGKNAKIIALGGIHKKNVKSVRKAGFNGAAVLGSIWKSNDPVTAFRKLRSAMQ